MSDISAISAVILAAGRGSRLQSDKPKVLHQIGGVPMIFHTLDKLASLNLNQIIIVTGHLADQVESAVKSNYSVTFIRQLQPLGTGDAVLTGLTKVTADSTLVLVANGDDSAFYQPETIQQFIDSHHQTQAVASMLISHSDLAQQIGAIKLSTDGYYQGIINPSEVDPQTTPMIICCGLYIFNRSWLAQNLSKIEPNRKGEYPLTKLFDIAKDQNQIINLFKLTNPAEWSGINTPADLKAAQKLWETQNNVEN